MKNKIKILIFIFFTSLSSMLLGFTELTNRASAATWYDGSWNYRKEITLSSPTTIVNQQIKIELTNANFDYTKIQTDGDDLRFTANDGTTLQDYWVESWVSGGTSVIWVKIVNLGTTNFYMYYGNVTVSSSSVATPVVLFDDFGTNDNVDGGNAAALGYTWHVEIPPWGITNFYQTCTPNSNQICWLIKDFGGVTSYKRLEVEYGSWGGFNVAIGTTQAWTGGAWVNIGAITFPNFGTFIYDIPAGTSKIKIWKTIRHNNGLVLNSWKFLPEASPNIIFGVESSILPTCDSFSASPSSIFLGNSSNLTWTTTNVVSISVVPPVGVVTVDNIAGVGVMPNTTTTYTITAFNNNGATTTCTATVSVTLTPPPPPPPLASGGHSELDYFDKDVVVVLNDAIKVALSWVGSITLLFLIIGGVLYVSSGSNPETQDKAKKIITYAIIGLMLSLMSYAIIAVIDKISV